MNTPIFYVYTNQECPACVDGWSWSSTLPGMRSVCDECAGTGLLIHEVPLIEALAALGIHVGVKH